MRPLPFIRSLQLMDCLFPVGAFAYSDGLETAVVAGLVRDADSLGVWMNHFLEGVFVPCEGLALLKCHRAFDSGDLDALRRLDEELTALRPSAETRAAGAGVGKRLLSLYSAICGDEQFAEKAKVLPRANAAAAYALVLSHSGVGEREAVLAYGYNRLAGFVSAGLRLISMGQQEGQMLLTQSLRRLPAALVRILDTSGEPLRAFNPLLDIQQMNHRYVYSRLFRS